MHACARYRDTSTLAFSYIPAHIHTNMHLRAIQTNGISCSIQFADSMLSSLFALFILFLNQGLSYVERYRNPKLTITLTGQLTNIGSNPKFVTNCVLFLF